MSRPAAVRIVRIGGVDRAPFETQRDALAEKDSVADPAVNAVVGEDVGRIIREVQPRVSAQHIEEIFSSSEVQYQARGAQRQAGRGSAALRRRLLVSDVELDAHCWTEEVSKPSAATDLIAEVERLIVAGE